MRPLFLLLVTICICYSCQNTTPSSPDFTIKGDIDGLDDGTATLMRLNLVDNETIYVDTVNAQDGKFEISGDIGAPYFHSLMLNNDRGKRLHFFIEKGVMDIKGSYDNLSDATISGSIEDSLLGTYNFNDIFRRDVGMEIMEKYNDKAFAAFTAFYQFQVNQYPMDSMKYYLDNFTGDAKSSVYFSHLDTLYRTLKNVAISSPAPAFSMPDVDGKEVNLEDFKGKYVLLDFWASWCAPCRAANPGFVEAYNEINNPMFEIVGISVDKDKEKWLKAVTDDELPWINLSHTKGWGAVSKMYAVKSVPQNFLLDPNGVILAKNIEPEDLHEVMKKYL